MNNKKRAEAYCWFKAALLFIVFCELGIVGNAKAFQVSKPTAQLVPGSYLLERRAGQSTADLLAQLEGQFGNNVEIVDEIPARRLVQIRISPELLVSQPELLAQSMSDTGKTVVRLQSVEAAEPVIRYKLADASNDIARVQQSIADVGKQIAFTNLPRPTGANAKPVVVAVIDTGVMLTHEVFAGMLVPGADVTSGAAAGDGGTIQLVGGGVQTHGTAIAGMLAMILRGASIDHAPLANVKIMPIRATTQNDSIDSIAAIKAVDYAVAHGAAVINASWGNGQESRQLQRSMLDADAAHVVIVVSAGNGEQVSQFDPLVGYDIDKKPFYPASWHLPNVLAVAALNYSGNLAGFSNWGHESVSVAAPGENIIAPAPDVDSKPGKTVSGYQAQSGTSISTPIVCGVVALMEAIEGVPDSRELVARIGASATKSAALSTLISGGTVSVRDAFKHGPLTAGVWTGPWTGLTVASGGFEDITAGMTQPQFTGAVLSDAPVLLGKETNGRHRTTANLVDFLVELSPGVDPQKALWLPAARGTVKSVELVRPDLYAVKVDSPVGKSAVSEYLKKLPDVKSTEQAFQLPLQ